MIWKGMEDNFSVFRSGNFLPFPFHTKIFRISFRSTFRLEATQPIICIFAMLGVSSRVVHEGTQPLAKVRLT